MAKQVKANKFVTGLKNGFKDIQAVLSEGNFKLFLKQCILILVVFLLYRYLTGVFTTKVQGMNEELEAIAAQKANQQEYITNKKLLLSLEPLFADVEDKNEWLVSQVIDIFKKANVTLNVAGAQTEDASNETFVTTSLPINSDTNYERFANLLASIENRDEYVRVSEFSIEKGKDPNVLDLNKISMRINTLFPKEKLSKTFVGDGSSASKRAGRQSRRRG